MGVKLTKVAQKIFASSPGVNQIAKFGSLAAGSPAFTTDPLQAMSFSNWLTGWFGAVIGGASPAIEDMNAVHFVETRQLAYLQQMGIAEWDGVTEYFVGSIVNSGGVLYVSKTDNNVNNATTDTTNWKLFAGSGDPTGAGKDFWGSVLPAGFVWAAGRTIGNGASNATERANADTFDLFSLFWSTYSDAALPIYTSAGVLSARGANALADWNANKAITVIDKRGRISAGKDNMGGTAASRLTGATIDGTVLGNSGGEETHTLSIGEMPSHQHSGATTAGAGPGYYGNITAPGGASGLNPNNGSTGFTGGGAAHNNVQPTIVCNYILKL